MPATPAARPTATISLSPPPRPPRLIQFMFGDSWYSSVGTSAAMMHGSMITFCSQERSGVPVLGGDRTLSTDVPSRDGTIVIGATTAKDLGVRPGDAVALLHCRSSDRGLVVFACDRRLENAARLAGSIAEDERGQRSYGTVLAITGKTDFAAANAAARRPPPFSCRARHSPRSGPRSARSA